ncbi:LacI family DNA-binding transcriptional regulator [Buttiauxella agrestis]|uniref:LacI family DNA-binding transcriptional regulator n=1 Tax=Buttiauxella agrestis TaxID=82977 RepID=UPI0015605D04|nr:LacI family DNA-binding transcriptional regulator [Buttiauxella agrestis]BCG09711.1 LacI family DNA-binding transcriptional regulator [Buttiauxella agrestis]
MSTRQATLNDVAREAGVSQQTVSRVLNSPDLVSSRTREKVLHAMNVLHYVPNRSAQLLAGKTMPALGLITSSLTYHAPSQIAAAIKSHAEEQQLQVSVAMPKGAEYEALQAVLNEFRAQNIRGVIANLPLESTLAEQLARENDDLACLFLDVPPETDVSCVRFDHQDGSGACVKHLWELGHRQFGLLAGPAESISARLRLGCWRETLHRFGVSNAITAWGDWSASSGWAKTFELIHANPLISAIIVANDQMALGVLSALAQLKRSGANAVSVTGYDDTADSLFFQPALTTVAQDFDLLGKRAVEIVTSLMAQSSSPQKILKLLPTRLVIRESTYPFPQNETPTDIVAQLKLLINQL